MTKETLIQMGLAEEQADKIAEELNKAYVPKTHYDEVSAELKAAKATIKERDTQLETLKKSTGDVEALKKQFDELQAKNKTDAESHAAEIKAMKINNAVEKALSDAKAINPATVIPLLKDFLAKAELADDGALRGLAKETLIQMGLAEEQADKIAEELNKAYVPKTHYDEVSAELKAAKATIKERDTQLETLKKSTGDVEALKKQFDELQAKNKTDAESHAAEIKAMKINNAVEKALSDAKAINPATVIPLLKDFLAKAELADDGALRGLADEIGKLAKAEETSFLFKADTSNKSGISGAAPAGSATTSPDPKLQGYQTRLADARKNGDTHAAILIKQEAASEGISLL